VVNVAADPPTEDTVAITVKKAVTVITEDVAAVLDHQAMTEIEEEVEIVTDITNAEIEADPQDREEAATIDSAEADLLNRREIPEWKEVRGRDQTAKSTTENPTEEAHKVISNI
jgi:hypothetical protein